MGAVGDIASAGLSFATSAMEMEKAPLPPGGGGGGAKPWEAEGITEEQWHLNKVAPKGKKK